MGMKTGWVFFDDDCVWCRFFSRFLTPLLRFHGFQAVPLQTPGVANTLGSTDEQLRRQVHVLTLDGRCFGGADALLEIARARRYSRPLASFGSRPSILPLLRKCYAWIAARRPCANGRCPAKTRRLPRGWLTWLPVFIVPIAAWSFCSTLAAPPWISMWTLAIALFAACKWLTLREASANNVPLRGLTGYYYAFGWVGMEPREFSVRVIQFNALRLKHWAGAVGRTLLGTILTWGVVRHLVGISPLLAGWIGMTGIILILHFGFFDLLALCWRSAGYWVTPLMNGPTQARSVGNFWSARWNRGFNVLAQRFIHSPTTALFGRTAGVLTTFFVSGVIHDFVITIPAREGYGLPTAYFVFQAIGLLFERSQAGRRLGLGRGVLGRVFTIAIVALPAFWLFPPVFVANVILPMLHSIGAT